jgi:hypothetical protein
MCFGIECSVRLNIGRIGAIGFHDYLMFELNWASGCAVCGAFWVEACHERLSRTEERFDMRTFSDSYVARVLLAPRASGCALDAVSRRWRRLSASLFDPYQPERHYMRGPGPKWREKHGRNVGL